MPLRESSRASATSQDLSALLTRFGRFSIHGPDKIASKEKVKVFGPERLVEDPRIKKLYQSIVRDIVVIASSLGVVCLVLCFTVPMKR